MGHGWVFKLAGAFSRNEEVAAKEKEDTSLHKQVGKGFVQITSGALSPETWTKYL